MGLKAITLNLLLMGLFVLAIITFGVNFGIENEANQSIIDDPQLLQARSELMGNFTSYGAEVSQASNAFGNTTPIVNTGGINILPITDTWKKFTSIPVNLYDISVGFVFSKLFGDEIANIMFYVVSAIVTILIILAAWATIRTGSSD